MHGRPEPTAQPSLKSCEACQRPGRKPDCIDIIKAYVLMLTYCCGHAMMMQTPTSHAQLSTMHVLQTAKNEQAHTLQAWASAVLWALAAAAADAWAQASFGSPGAHHLSAQGSEPIPPRLLASTTCTLLARLLSTRQEKAWVLKNA